MDQRDGWKHDDDGWYDDGWYDDGSTSDAADTDIADEEPNPYRALPPRVAVEDMVGETDVSVPPFDPAGDPNREIANRWGAGIAGF